MKHLLTVILLIVCIPSLTNTQTKQVPIMGGFMRGKDYLDLSAGEKRAYAMGAINGMLIAPAFDAPKDKVSWLETCISNMTDDQVAAIITKYVTDHPGEWHHGMNILTFNAISTTCPHPKDK